MCFEDYLYWNHKIPCNQILSETWKIHLLKNQVMVMCKRYKILKLTYSSVESCMYLKILFALGMIKALKGWNFWTGQLLFIIKRCLACCHLWHHANWHFWTTPYSSLFIWFTRWSLFTLKLEYFLIGQNWFQRNFVYVHLQRLLWENFIFSLNPKNVTLLLYTILDRRWFNYQHARDNILACKRVENILQSLSKKVTL